MFQPRVNFVELFLSTNDSIGGDGGDGEDYSLTTSPTNGTVTETSDGVFVYTPNADFNGTDSFTYTITDADGDTDTATVVITVASVDDTPTATDDTATVNEDASTTITVSTNDAIGGDGGDGEDYSLTSGPSNGTVTETADGVFVYSPNADFNGTDSFTYTITDADGDTRIQVEKGMDDDTIRFDMNGTEHFRMGNGRLEVLNTGGSLFIGDGAGANDDLSDNNNVFIGDSAGTNNTLGFYNVANGYRAGYSSKGDSSIYIGNRAGYFNKSSNRLYIENSDADSTDAFIYGQFDNDILSLNANVGIDTLSPSEKLHVSGGNLLLDRKDEGLLVRAGASVIHDEGTYRAVYSAGSEWVSAGGKDRPTYDVFYQELNTPCAFAEEGRRILTHRREIEHGLGRPQIIGN